MLRIIGDVFEIERNKARKRTLRRKEQNYEGEKTYKSHELATAIKTDTNAITKYDRKNATRLR